MQSFRTVSVIPARMDSTRFPGKPMKEILGIPMIQHVFYRAQMINNSHEVCVATCDKVIYECINDIGGLAIMTSNSHERATDRTAEALIKLKEEYNKEFDIVAMIQGDEPMFKPDEVASGIAEIQNNPETNIVNLMNKSNSHEELSDPNNVKVVFDNKNDALYFSREPIPSDWNKSNEISGYIQTGLIIFKVSYLNKYLKMQTTPLEEIESCDMLRVLENGEKIKMLEIPTRSIGVDVQEDLRTAEKLMQVDPILAKYLDI
tara:strand:+ start:994 stop:1776 length:783 start_codon:yes stop_codon:yes gene_type:complete